MRISAMSLYSELQGCSFPPNESETTSKYRPRRRFEELDALCWQAASRLSTAAREITDALSRGDLETAVSLAGLDDVDETLWVAV